MQDDLLHAVVIVRGYRGLREQLIFPEIDYDKIDSIRGLDITITTTARNPEEGRALLEAFNFPFKK